MPEIDADAIRTLAKLLDETALNEIEYQTEALRIRVAKTSQTIGAPFPLTVGPSTSEFPVSASVASSAQENEEEIITAPMVGTVYLASKVGALPMIRVGDTVKKDQALLVVEAMKVMNTIRAPHDGVIKRICVTDGQPVEFGEPLVVLA
ncbi:MAG: acetyl-CoA carboxylase, biotin carboxyl carrier protein [Holosporales bacterium]|jgi:acetyl-CoA carboxylase biotin carboxyl carrier protein|nr:acetyl-CoA carboxylase, biotin carboxyl carrier protein [Holosporales bacterium]